MCFICWNFKLVACLTTKNHLKGKHLFGITHCFNFQGQNWRMASMKVWNRLIRILIWCLKMQSATTCQTQAFTNGLLGFSRSCRQVHLHVLYWVMLHTFFTLVYLRIKILTLIWNNSLSILKKQPSEISVAYPLTHLYRQKRRNSWGETKRMVTAFCHPIREASRGKGTQFS